MPLAIKTTVRFAANPKNAIFMTSTQKAQPPAEVLSIMPSRFCLNSIPNRNGKALCLKLQPEAEVLSIMPSRFCLNSIPNMISPAINRHIQTMIAIISPVSVSSEPAKNPHPIKRPMPKTMILFKILIFISDNLIKVHLLL